MMKKYFLLVVVVFLLSATSCAGFGVESTDTYPLWTYLSFGNLGKATEVLHEYYNCLLEADKYLPFVFINKKGERITDFEFDEAMPFSEGLALARIQEDGESKYGFIRKDGSYAIKPQFKYAKSFQGGLAQVDSVSDRAFINQKGDEVFEVEYDYASYFSEGLAPVMSGDWDDGEWGYIDWKGECIIDPQFDYACSFTEGLAMIRMGDWEEGEFGFINKKGKIEINPRFDVASDFVNGLACVAFGEVDSYKWGYIDRRGKFVIEPQFAKASPFFEGLAFVREEDEEQYGYIDKSGDYVIEPQFDEASIFIDGLALVGVGGKYGFIDKDGKFAINPKYIDATPFIDGLACVKVGNKWGFIDKSGEFVIEPQYDHPAVFSEGLACIMLGGGKDEEEEKEEAERQKSRLDVQKEAEELRKYIESLPDLVPDETYTEVEEAFLDLHIVVVSMLDEDENKDIYLMDETGRNPKRLTTYPSVESFPCITDDGDHLYYISDKDGEDEINPFQIFTEIYHLDLRTEELTRLTDDNRMDYGLSVSGDGSRIVYMTQEMGQEGFENPQMILMDGDGGNAEVIQDEALKNCIPKISGDGNWIVFNSYREGSYDIYLMDLRDPEEYKTINLTNSFVSEYFPTINHDGTVIVYEKLLNGVQDATAYELFRIDRDGENETALTFDRFCDSFPVLTADGEWVVFISKRWDWDDNDKLDEALFIMDINGENLMKISKHPEYFDQPDV